MSTNIGLRAAATALFLLAGQHTAVAQSSAPDRLRIHFASGAAGVSADQAAKLDQAARLYREGSPLVMIVAGGSDTVGAPRANLELSLRRARSVADGLIARGIPAERLQVLGRGQTELVTPTPADVPEPDNRVVEITWR